MLKWLKGTHNVSCQENKMYTSSHSAFYSFYKTVIFQKRLIDIQKYNYTEYVLNIWYYPFKVFFLFVYITLLLYGQLCFNSNDIAVSKLI